MASSNNRTKLRPCDEGMYTSEGLKNLTLDDGTRIVTSPVTDIKRPVCAGIDVHKSVLMAAICVTDKETLNAVFYVRQFTSSNGDIRLMAEWFSSYNVVDVCMESTGKYWISVYDILEQNGLKPLLTHPKYVKQAKGRKTEEYTTKGKGRGTGLTSYRRIVARYKGCVTRAYIKDGYFVQELRLPAA